MKKISNKKIIGGFLGVMLIATIGVAIVTAESDDSNEEQQNAIPFSKDKMFGQPPLLSELSEEQQEEIQNLIESLREKGATPEDIRNEINTKLDEYGIFDERLDNEIKNTEQRLEILNREKELRQQGYSWEEIQDIIQDEFNLEFPTPGTQMEMQRHGFHHGPCMEPSSDIHDDS